MIIIIIILAARWASSRKNSGNLPYLVANTYGLNFIETGGI